MENKQSHNFIKNKIFILLVYITLPYLLGEIILFSKMKFNLMQSQLYSVYRPMLFLVFISVCMGIFLYFMMLLGNRIINNFKYGKFIGLICASILPLIWAYILILSALGIGEAGNQSPVLGHFFFMLFNEETLSCYFILVTMIILNNFIVHRRKQKSICTTDEMVEN